MTTRPSIWAVGYLLVVAAFVGAVARYYHPDFGFTALIEFPAAAHGEELPAVRELPHFDHPDSGGYDGQFYAQLAVEPLVADPAIDSALDQAPYRARRILASWLAYVAGLGRPAWVLQAYALHAVMCWLLLAWLLVRPLAPRSGRHFVLWSTALLAHGPLMSVRYALPDLLAAVLVTAAVLAAERGRLLLAAMTLGAAGLARETSIAAGGLIARWIGRSPRSWLLAFVAGLVCLAPLLVWVDYLRSIYHAAAWATGGNLTAPLTGLAWKIGDLAAELGRDGFTAPWLGNLLALVAVLTQALWLGWILIVRRERSAWALSAVGFLALVVLIHPAVWEGNPGAYPRVLIPLTVAAKVTLARDARASWWLVAASSLDVVAGVQLMFAFEWP